MLFNNCKIKNLNIYLSQSLYRNFQISCYNMRKILDNVHHCIQTIEVMIKICGMKGITQSFNKNKIDKMSCMRIYDWPCNVSSCLRYLDSNFIGWIYLIFGTIWNQINTKHHRLSSDRGQHMYKYKKNIHKSSSRRLPCHRSPGWSNETRKIDDREGP